MADLADRTGGPSTGGAASNARADGALLEGRLEEAERRARGALEIGGLRQSEYVTYLFEHALLVAIRWMQGRLGELGAIRLQERYSSCPLAQRAGRGRAGRRAGGQGGGRAPRLRDFTDRPRDGLWLLHLCGLAEACVLLGDERRAARLYELLSPYADRNAISMTTMPFGPVALRLGMVAAMLGRWEEANATFSWPWSGAPAVPGDHGPCPVRARTDAGRRGEEADLAGAAELLARAEGICRELDLPGVGDRVAALAASIDPRPGCGRGGALRARCRLPARGRLLDGGLRGPDSPPPGHEGLALSPACCAGLAGRFMCWSWCARPKACPPSPSGDCPRCHA